MSGPIARRRSARVPSAITPVLQLVILASLIVGCAGVPIRTGPVVKNDYGFADKYLDWLIRKRMSDAKVAGFSVAIVDDQRVVWSKGYGYADVAAKTVATSDTLYHAGSVSKVITAAEVMLYVNRREIGLDSNLEEQLPGFSIHSRFAGAKPITIRSLVAHHSGMPFNRLNGMWAPHPVDLATLQKELASESLVVAPQTCYGYSNLDFSLLGRVIEVRSQRGFADAVRSDLLQPIGMTHSTFGAVTSSMGTLAKGYVAEREMSPIGLRDVPAGALVTSANDMARFISWFLAGGRTASGEQLVEAAILQSMTAPQYKGLPLDFGHEIGLGWMIQGVSVPGAGPIIWHVGEYPGYFANLTVAPQSKLGVIVFTNSEQAKDVTIEVAGKAIELALEAKRGSRVDAQRPLERDPQRVSLSKNQLAQYSGDYVFFGDLHRIEQDDQKLTTELFGRHFNLLSVSNDTFIPEASALFGLYHVSIPKLSLRFTSVGDRRFAVLHGLPQPFPFERVERRAPPTAWSRRLGDYVTSGGRLNTMRLELENGILLALVKYWDEGWRFWQNVRIALVPVSDDEAAVVGVGTGLGGVFRATGRPGQESISYQGFIFTPHKHP